MDFHRSLGDIQLASDFLVRQAAADAIENVALARRNRLCRVGALIARLRSEASELAGVLDEGSICYRHEARYIDAAVKNVFQGAHDLVVVSDFGT